MKVRQLTNDEVETIARDARRRNDEPVLQLANEVMGIRSRVKGGEIMAESIVSAKDGRGRVRLSWHDNEAFLDVEIATGLGQSIIEAACAARIDALFAAVLTKDMGLDGDAAGDILRAVRGARRIDDGRPS